MDSSIISEKDIRYCFEFTQDDISKRKDVVVVRYFENFFPSVVIQPISNMSSNFSCILYDLNAGKDKMDFSTLFSYSSNIVFCNYQMHKTDLLCYLNGFPFVVL